MYEEAFDSVSQEEMRDYFCGWLACQGIERSYEKNQFITIDGQSFGIVTKGCVAKSIVSAQGKEKLLYLLRPGEIFGEMNLVGGGALNYMVRAKEASAISFVSQKILKQEIIKNPAAYLYIIHSITRKFRIVLLQSTNSLFNDSRGKIAEALLRLAACSEPQGGAASIITAHLTQNELAQNIGCSRITVTRVLNEFKKEHFIRLHDKKIVILDIEALVAFTDRIQ